MIIIRKIFKTLYGLIPFKKFWFGIIKLFWIPGDGILKHLHFKGIITIKIDDAHSFKMHHYGYQIENELYWKGIEGAWEKVSLGLWIKLCGKAKVILDIGANTGVYALVAQCMQPSAKIYAFEPVERVRKKMLLNSELNGYSIIGVAEAVSNINGKATIYDTPTEHILSVTLNRNLHKPDVQVIPIEIHTISIASFIEKQNLDSVDLIKMDVEFHEVEVVEGIGPYLKKYMPSMIIEILEEKHGKQIEAMLEGLGYCYFNINELGHIHQADHIGRSDYYNWLICTRQTASFLELL